MAKGIYLDNGTTTRPSDRTVSRMLPFLTQMWGTPTQPHQMGQELFPSLEESYEALYELLGAKKNDDVIFTSSGAEAVNHVIFSTYYDVTQATGKNHFLTSSIDEAPVIMSIGRLEHLGCVGKMVHPDHRGIITTQTIADNITPRTALVSLSWANGLTGVINPVSEIAKLCKQRGILLHLEATHVLGKLAFHLEEIGADFLSFNGDHLHAPKGTGALYVKSGVKCSPFILGGIEQGGFRAGSFNMPGLVSLGHAAKEALDSRDLLCTEVARLRNTFESAILASVPDATVFFRDQDRVPHCTAIGFPGVPNEALLFALNRKGVYASIGGGNYQQIGLILAASGIDNCLAHTALNFTLSRETTDDEIDRAVEIIKDAVKKLRKVSGNLYSSESGRKTAHGV
jgi:cysteine desulfurase